MNYSKMIKLLINKKQILNIKKLYEKYKKYGFGI